MPILPRLSTRFLAFGLSAGSLLLASAGLHAQQVVLKVHHFSPSTSNTQVKLIEPWCAKIAKESAQRMTCQIYPAMQLGGTPAQLFDQARDGVADIVWTIPTYATGRFTKSEVFELPWMISNAQAGSQALWTYVQENALDEYKGVRPIFMHVQDGSLLHFNKKQPKTLADLKGLKIRAATRTNARILTALGATPVQMPLPQVPEAMAKGVIDGAAVPWEGAPSIKLAEIANYHLDAPRTAPRISTSIFLFGINQAKYNSLPADLKKVIDDNSGLATSAWAGKEGFDNVIEGFKDVARARGNVFYDLPDAEYQRWVVATKSVEQDWIKSATAKKADGVQLAARARALLLQYQK